MSIDAGTQSIRAVLIDLNGMICDIAKIEIEPYFSNKPGFAEQYPNYFYDKLCEATKKLFTQTQLKKEQISGVTLTTQRSTLINLDKYGNALRPAIVWLDQRMAEVGKFPSKAMQAALAVVNMRESVIHAIRNGECNWIMQNEPDIWKKTDKFLFLSGYLTLKLTGENTDSIGCTVGYLPFDYKKHHWVAKKHLNFKMFPVDQEKLPKLVKPSEVLGYITKKCSEETGIPAGLPLLAAASDKACEVLGSGVYSPGTACLSYGTTATVQTTSDKYYEIVPFFPPYPSAVPGNYNTEVMIYRGFWMVNWFKQQFGQREMLISKETGQSPEYLFDEMISSIPPGSLGLTLQPYWSPGVKIPGTEAKGAIIGFGDVHTRAHIYRAILEGLAYALKEGLQRTERRTKTPISKIIVSGGGSQSRQAMQLTADIFDLPVIRPHTFETSALGAAINAAVGMKFYDNFECAVQGMCRTGELFTAKNENRDIYEKLYNNVYLKMYKRLQPLYDKIRNITNYPPKKL
jgi:sugar (pentulose or hexulose) kinase